MDRELLIFILVKYYSCLNATLHHPGIIDIYTCELGPTRQNTLFPETRPGILNAGQLVDGQEVATPIKKKKARVGCTVQLMSKLIFNPTRVTN